MKKTILILGVIILIIALLMGGYYYYFFIRNKPAEMVQTENGNLPIIPNNPLPSGDNEEENGEVPANTNNETRPSVRRFTDRPVLAGEALNRAGETFVRFIERGTGHIYEKKLDTDSESRLSIKTITRIYEADFTADGKGIILRYVKDGEIQTLFGKIPDASENQNPEIIGSFFVGGIDNAVLSPTGDRIFYLKGQTNDSVIGYVSKSNPPQPTRIFSSPLREWVIDWPNSNTIALTTKASNYSLGFLTFLDIRNGSSKNILNGRGISTLTDPTLKYVMVSEPYQQIISSSAFNTSTEKIIPLAPATLPDKCLWSKKLTATIYCGAPRTFVATAYPDAWYQGLVYFSDDIYRYSAIATSSIKIASLKETTGIDIDAIKLFSDPNEDNLFFVNKNDDSLWVVEL